MSTQSSVATVYQKALIDKLCGDELIRSPWVEAAFRAVPRHLFLPDVPIEQAYEDRAIPTKFAQGRAISSSSQPAMMAIMLEQLDLRPGHSVLEIGAGTGYNAALMAHIVGERGQVTTLDIDEEIVLAARQHLQAADANSVRVIWADGALGWPSDAPYDRIIMTVGGWDISPAWVEHLGINGRLLLPLSLNGPQISVAFDRENNHLSSQSVTPCGFMRLRGPFAEPDYSLSLGSVPDLSLESIRPLPDNADVIYEWLHAPARKWPTGIRLHPRELWRDLMLWLALCEPHFCHLIAQGEAADGELVPTLFQQEDDMKWQGSIGLWAKSSLAMLQQKRSGEQAEMELIVCDFGPESTAAQQLIAAVHAWHESGRPGVNNWKVLAYPLDQQITSGENEMIVPKQWYQFVLRWREK
jgi:protein-L-isoaspartate(D-aspartate) O-methyltransferase